MRVVSGMLINCLKMQNEGNECFFFIANQHAITLPQNPKQLYKQTLDLLAVLLAVGLDPHKSTIFLQSLIVFLFEA